MISVAAISTASVTGATVMYFLVRGSAPDALRAPNDTQLAVDARATSSPGNSETRTSPAAPSIRSCTNSTAL